MVSFRLLLATFLFACGGMAKGQSNYYESEGDAFSGGIVAGLNLAQVDGDLYFGYTKPGLVAGFFVRANLKEKLSADIELLYDQKGSIGDAMVESLYAGTYIARCHIGLDYVSVPVTLQYRLKAVTFEGGVSYSRLIRTKEWIVATPSVVIDEEKNRFGNSDVCGIIGVSRTLYGNFIANVRFQYSLVSIRPIDRVPEGYGYGTTGQLNNLFSFRIMYVF